MIYLDTSAFLETVLAEPQSAALRDFLGTFEVPRFVSSALVLEAASRLPDPALRSLDAIHVATALLIREDIDVLINYDKRTLAAAAAHGLPTAAPA